MAVGETHAGVVSTSVQLGRKSGGMNTLRQRFFRACRRAGRHLLNILDPTVYRSIHRSGTTASL